MNQQHPTVEQFLGTPYSPEEDHDEAPSLCFQGVDLMPVPDAIWQIPESPLESIAHDVRAILNHLADGPERTGRSISDALNKAASKGERNSRANGLRPEDQGSLAKSVSEPEKPAQDWTWDAEAMADLEAKHQVALQVIADVDAALGKSTAKPALAAKAVIEAWRNPQVEVAGLSDEEKAEIESHLEPEGWQPPDTLTADQVLNLAANPDLSGAEVLTTTGPVKQPEHAAPVEEWREYARALGYAGPEIDKANRSQIRTALGISQVAAEGGA